MNHRTSIQEPSVAYALGGSLVVVGAGCAGVEAAFSARQAGWQGPITLIGGERAEPYHRPPLSKAFLQGNAPDESLPLRPQVLYEKARVAWMPGVHVMRIDRIGKSVECDDGRLVSYDKLVLACGGRARRLDASISGSQALENVHYLRTLEDALSLRTQLAHGERVVILGAGYVGLEVASVSRALGLDVTILEAAPRVLARVTGHVVSSFYEALHRDQGANLQLNARVSGFDLTSDGRRAQSVLTSDGRTIPADVVVVGIGLVPAVELAQDVGLETEDGVLVDSRLRTSDPDILAIGDCARLYHAGYGRSLRVESVPNALEHARQAAATLCGKARELEPVPWFWSDQYNVKLRTAGLPDGHDRVVLRGNLHSQSFSAFYLKGNRLLAVDTVNRPGEFVVARKLVLSLIEDADRLADETFELKGLLA